MSHNADFATAPLFAVLSSFHSTLVPEDVVAALTTFRGEHTFASSTFSPPYDAYPRNITAWLAPNITIGAESFNETGVGGPALNTNTFNPALIQWNTGNGIGWLNVRFLLKLPSSWILTRLTWNPAFRDGKTRHCRSKSRDAKYHIPRRQQLIHLHASRVSIRSKENNFRAARYSRSKYHALWDDQYDRELELCWWLRRCRFYYQVC